MEVRFTADFTTAVTSTSSASCRGGAYRAHALNVASSADTLLRIEGGGVAKACGASNDAPKSSPRWATTAGR